jgi:Xaa-Pro aminopeptidase
VTAAAVVVYADSIRSAEMRHEVPLPVPDPFLYVERNGARTVVCSAFEMQRIREVDPRIETLSPEAFGFDELVTQMDEAEATLTVLLRACERLEVTAAAVPPTFPVELADHLRANGIEVAVERRLFEDRRRRKSPTELAALRRVQRACEAALDAARALLRQAEPREGELTLDGEPLTVERVKREIERVFGDHDVVADEFIVSHGPQTAVGHELGSGTLRPDEPIVFDLFPRDRATGVYSDMTRTYVVGTPGEELREYHRLVREALARTTAAARPGVNGRALMEIACTFFAEHGHRTPLTKEPGEVLESGFLHGLGHGVGLEVHERPWLSRAGDDLVAGDVITLEPGLYRAGYGGVRLEDILVVTEDGADVVTDYPYDLVP